ncbi:MAG: hypothetical protein FWD84_05980 [Oscillospiraceae bacterium]|nr:hypothetical protein [Oscillospiraceae bacterium]
MGFIQRFFIGRNGVDQLNRALLVVSIVLTILSRFLFANLFGTVAYVVMFLCIFRMISRNLERRRQENAAFLKLLGRHSPKSPYRYFKCPRCKQQLRAPKGKGKIKITCSNCGEVFYKKV